jgi:WD40 repeat protein
VSTEIRCDYNGCNIEDRFQIISLPDMQVLYSWEGGYKDMHGQNPVFSPDGSLILTRVENQITIWRTSDQTLVTSIKNIQGNSPAMFSRDSSLIAIGQLDTTQIWDVSSGEPLQTIKGLCGSLYDAPQPIFLGAKSILVLECSRSGKGTVSRWLVADGTATFKRDFGDIAISRIVVDENKNQVSVLANPRKVGPWLFPRIPHTIQFLNNGDLTFRQHDDQLRDISCIIKLNGEMPDCFENLILGTDEQFYSEAFQDNLVKFYRGFTTDGNSTYSLRDLKRWEPGALDPVHGLLFYTTHPLSPCNSESYVMDLATTQTRGKWQCFYIQNAVFSDNGNYAALCRKKDTTFITDKAGLDYLTIFDLSKKETIRQESFTCDVPIAFSSDGSKLIAADTYTKIIGGYVYNRHKLLVMNVLQPIEKNIFDVGCDTLTAIASHPDDSILAVACNDGTLRFLNPDIASEIYRLTNIDPDIWGLAFSKDGTMLAMASKRGYISIWAIPHL